MAAAAVWAASLSISHSRAFASDNSAGQNLAATDLTELSLQSLMQVEVTSVSKRAEKLSDAAAAVYVISGQEINQFGFSTIQDSLRLAPGTQVARIDAGHWAVSIRGFNDIFANQLLVMMDGRSIYNPTFSGVYWDQQDYILQDLERIEVVRGAGGTMWGANAVHGVINIVSKDSADTQGWLFTTQGGTDVSNVGVRYGGRLDGETTYRVYGKGRHIGEGAGVFDDPEDHLSSGQAGFRLDRKLASGDKFTLQGDVFAVDESEGLRPSRGIDGSVGVPTVPGYVSDVGGNVLARFTHEVEEGNQQQLQVYFDTLRRMEYGLISSIYTVDLDYQHHIALRKHDMFTYGAEARVHYDDFENNPGVTAFEPSSKTYGMLSAFAQYELAVVPDRFYLTGGTKLEWSSESEFMLQPSGRARLNIDEHNTVWGAISRAYRTPSRAENDADTTVLGGPIAIGVQHGSDLRPEKLTDYELGYRWMPTSKFSLDLSTFYSTHRQGLSASPSGPPGFDPDAGAVVLPVTWQNVQQVDTYGFELASRINVTQAWSVGASYSIYQLVLLEGTLLDPYKNSPAQQGNLTTTYHANKYLDLNSGLFVTGDAGSAPGYIRLDANAIIHMTEQADLQIGVQNALDDRHLEFPLNTNGTVPTETETSAYIRLTMKF